MDERGNFERNSSLPANAVAVLNVRDSTNVHVGDSLAIEGNVEINQLIVRKSSNKARERNENLTDDFDALHAEDEEPVAVDPYQNFLPDYRVVTKSEWKARSTNPGDELQTPVPYLIIAHTATETCPTTESNIYHLQYLQNYHMNYKKWIDIGYNFLIGGDGNIYEGRGWNVVGSHSREFNSKSICVAFVGTFCKMPPNEFQIDGGKKIINLLLAAGIIDENVKLVGHRQVMDTLSPGECLFNEIKTWPFFSENL